MVRIPASVKAAVGLNATRSLGQRRMRWLARRSFLRDVLSLAMWIAAAVAIPLIIFEFRTDRRTKDAGQEPQAASELALRPQWAEAPRNASRPEPPEETASLNLRRKDVEAPRTTQALEPAAVAGAQTAIAQADAGKVWGQQQAQTDVADQGAPNHDQGAAKRLPKNPVNPPARSPLIRRPGEDGDKGPVGAHALGDVAPFASAERFRFGRMRAQAGSRRLFRGRLLFWREGSHRVTGNARSSR